MSQDNNSDQNQTKPDQIETKSDQSQNDEKIEENQVQTEQVPSSDQEPELKGHALFEEILRGVSKEVKKCISSGFNFKPDTRKDGRIRLRKYKYRDQLHECKKFSIDDTLRAMEWYRKGCPKDDSEDEKPPPPKEENKTLDRKMIEQGMGITGKDSFQVTGQSKATGVMDRTVQAIEFEHGLFLEIGKFVRYELEGEIKINNLPEEIRNDPRQVAQKYCQFIQELVTLKEDAKTLVKKEIEIQVAKGIIDKLKNMVSAFKYIYYAMSSSLCPMCQRKLMWILAVQKTQPVKTDIEEIPQKELT